jgi:diaminohydroxyphosphoribosylaminopyrimidine deaminase/5-amino-6-(5-phosphoribosylamino)uracil reductase
MNDHSKFFNLALDRAFSQIGITSPNPAVGAVVVKDGVVISEGGTQVCGGNHAEVCALNAAGDAAHGADLYVTLEPCCHHGKTPPCTDAIIKAGIARVFVPLEDPNPCVAGKGISALRAAGVEVFLCEEFCPDAVAVTRPFLSRILSGRPHVIHKAAFTADGFTATNVGDSKWISSPQSRYLVHRLRAMCDAVIVGKGTVDADNPSLSCRLSSFPADVANYFSAQPLSFSGIRDPFLSRVAGESFRNAERSPLRVSIGLPSDCSGKSNFFADGNYCIFAKQNTVMDLYDAEGYELLPSLVEKGNIVLIPECENTVEFVMEILYERGINLILLEGGSTLASSFLQAGCIDEFLYFIAPKIAGGGKPVIKGAGNLSISDSLEISDLSIALCGSDVLYHGYALRDRRL